MSYRSSLAALRSSLPVGEGETAPAAGGGAQAPGPVAPTRTSSPPRGGLPLPAGWGVTFTSAPASAPWLPDTGRATLRDAEGAEVFFVDLVADTLRDIITGRGYPDRCARDLDRPAWWLWLMGAAPRPARPAESHWVIPVPLADRPEWVEAIAATAPRLAAEARTAAAQRAAEARAKAEAVETAEIIRRWEAHAWCGRPAGGALALRDVLARLEGAAFGNAAREASFEAGAQGLSEEEALVAVQAPVRAAVLADLAARGVDPEARVYSEGVGTRLVEYEYAGYVDVEEETYGWRRDEGSEYAVALCLRGGLPQLDRIAWALGAAQAAFITS